LDKITKESVTIGGWYEHTDGTVGEYRTLAPGQVQLVREVASWADVEKPDYAQQGREQRNAGV
jgi:hypothetical protein